MPKVNGGRRAYHSPTRAEAAERTRRAIVASATVLLTERGYAAASLREIAELAGVARPTVAAAFGSKPALLRQVLDEALAGDDEPVPVAQRPWFAPVWEATDPAGVLDAYAGVCTLIAGRAARLFEVVRRAAGDSADCAELWTTLTANRRAGAAMVVRRVVETGPLRTGLDFDRAVDALWLFNDPAHYDALVLRRGWPEVDYRGWLATQMRVALLGPGVDAPGGG
ncbi:TetR/AcrR family transcriptional regulator [Pseudonocardia acaciae]|uniref:TetR/AcrR family transcriptional regulator n=1 Tax=Pseudonocardia acaciae TaxID=551276 RepID=UPI00048F9222|nr:TetR/AcrR family transcriptional regulator [Pseudonocardia acaciae]